jgi:hypothetical protein
MHEPAAEGSTLHALRDLARELPGLVSDRVQLLALELRRAGQAVAQMVVLTVAAAVLLVTAWLALWAGLAVGAVQAGIPWGWALVVVVLVNAVAALLAFRRALRLADRVALPATVRRLTLGPQPGAQTSQASDRPVEAPAAASPPEQHEQFVS